MSTYLYHHLAKSALCNIIVVEFLALEKGLPIQVQETSRTPNRHDQNRSSPRHVIIKTTSTENRERILRPVRVKKQITYKGKAIKIIVDLFLNRNLKSKKGMELDIWRNERNNFSPRILYPPKLLFRIDGGTKVFHDKQKLKQYMTKVPCAVPCPIG
jgi:hypothetical protein